MSRKIEALIFASAEPVGDHVIRALVEGQGGDPAESSALVPTLIAAIRGRYEDHGVELVEVAKGWQFRTRPELAGALTTVVEKPRRLSRAAMEALAVIAYHQPCTRAEIEAIRGVTLSQTVLDALLEDGLIVPKGRKDVPGRPVLWGTSARFLAAFGLRDLAALPRREELLVDPAALVEAPEPEPETETQPETGAKTDDV
nr:SMC-Scp complex subunit ScpB [Acidomonas methanolica]